MQGRTVQSAKGKVGACWDRKRTWARLRAKRHARADGMMDTACQGFEIHWGCRGGGAGKLSADVRPNSDLISLLNKV